MWRSRFPSTRSRQPSPSIATPWRLTLVYDAVGTKAFEFGPIRLWIDRMPHLAQGEMWLELVAPDTAGGRAHLAGAGVVRCDEVEKLPPDLDGFWILNPAGIVHSGLLAGKRSRPTRRRTTRRRLN